MTTKSILACATLCPSPEQSQMLSLLTQGCQALSEQRRRLGRPASVSWTHLCLGLVLAIMQGWSVQLDLWRWICWEGWGDFAPVVVSDQAIYNRLQRAAEPMRRLFEQVSAWLRPQVEPWQDRCLAPFASQVLALDESTLDQVGRWLPWLRHLRVGADALLAGRISALFDVRLQQWVRIDLLKKGKMNSHDHALDMVQNMQPATLLLFDRGYLSFPFFDTLSSQGICWISRYAHRASFEVAHICYQGDGVLDAIVRLGIYRADQAKYPVRLVRFWMRSKQYSYLTNVLDPHHLSLADIVTLYARRWDIELAFRLLKDHLRLQEIWSAKWSVIQAQVWACLLLAQVYHALQVQIAAQAGVEVFDVSLDLLVRLVPQWIQRGLVPVAHAVRFGRELGIIRPSSRHRFQVPWVDPAWIDPPSQESCQPRAKVRYRSKCARATLSPSPT